MSDLIYELQNEIEKLKCEIKDIKKELYDIKNPKYIDLSIPGPNFYEEHKLMQDERRANGTMPPKYVYTPKPEVDVDLSNLFEKFN